MENRTPTAEEYAANALEHGLFHGLKVVELGQYIAAPYAAELLADGGADVVSIEPAYGSPTRFSDPLGGDGEGRQYVVKARGKRSLPVTIGSPEGQKILAELLADADVLVTNLRVSVANRLKLDWEHLAPKYPRLIFAEVRGFGETGPLADAGCVDLVAQASSGLLHATGRREEGRPKPPDVMIADFHAGSLLAFAIASALYQRERTGTGQKVSTSLLAASFSIQHRRASSFARVDQAWQDELREKTEALGQPGADDVEAIRDWRDQNVGTPPYFYNVYRMADGEVALGAVAANGPHVLRAAGLDPDRLENATQMQGLTVAETTDLVAAMFTQRSAPEVVAELRALGVPAAQVQFLEEAITDPTLVAAELWQRFDHPRLGPCVLPAAPVSFTASHFEPGTDTPEFGAHTDEIMRQLGYDEETIARLVADGIIARGFGPENPSRPAGGVHR